MTPVVWPVTSNSDEPRLSLFFAGDDWIAWTPEGYYAASPGGEKLMGWHVNNGRDKMASFYPADKFRKTLYRPDVIQRIVETGSVEKALALADAARGKQTERTEVAKILPPKVRITAPSTSGERLSKPEIEVRAEVQSVGERPVTTLRLLIDGRPFQGAAGIKRISPPKVGQASASWTVTLTPGKHRLQVLADSTVSQGQSSEVEVIYTGGNDDSDIARPNLYVLAIGVAKYRDEKLRLNFAAKDAVALANAFKTHGKPLFRKIEVKVITDDQATRGNILKGMNWLRQELTQRDYAVISFSGHGEKDADGSLYFLPVDADTADLTSTSVPADHLKKLLVALPGKVLTLLDACHSGGFDGPKKKNISGLTDDLVRDLVTDESGLVVMSSSTGREVSLENNEFRMGTFTLAVVEGLAGKGHKSSDGAVYLTHLDVYVTDRVKELTRGQQHPVTAKPSTIRSFPLSKP